MIPKSFARRWLLVLLIAAVNVWSVAAQEATSDVTPQDCAECHIDVVLQWQTSTHAQAYHDPEFQAAWHDAGEEGTCLTCHTTGFSARTGTYDHEGITCAACHGQTPANHPPEAVTINAGVEMCADCHPTTFNEWEHSAHGDEGLACTTCHTPHDQGLRFETSDALCLNCHTEAREDFAHVTHIEQTCTDCHWYRDLGNAEHVLTGMLMPTGHDGIVETRTCVDCHEEQGETQLVSSQSEHPLLEARVRIDELEAELQTTRVESNNVALTLGAQGLIVGASFTALLAIGFVAARSRRKRSEDSEK